jgi:pimeloyl-ACP methyl ester carboxylesterase
MSMADINGGKITYAIQGPESGPLILYLHGWGDDFRVVAPLEYPLIEAGFRLLVVHRPGYAGTTLEGEVDGKKVDWRTPSGFARAAAGLLDHLHGVAKWRTAVIGTSGGAPTALAFADLHSEQTKAVVIQAGVTHPWTDARFVPELFRDSYLTAFRQFGWAGDHVSQIIFGLLAKLRENFIDDEDKLRALMGSRLEEARRDPAFAAVVSTILREDPANRRGELNDVFNVFIAKTAYCRYESIKARTLILHDPEDKFVPFVHAENAAQNVPKALLRSFHLAGHIIWLGPDARAMHEARVDFLLRSV